MAKVPESSQVLVVSSESEVCGAMGLEDRMQSQLNLQSSATGYISYMNCVGVGLPFLTFNFRVTKDFLTRHNLKIGELYMMDTPSRPILTDALREFGDQLREVPATPGGVGMDIARIAQWLLPQPKTVAFLGTRGSDDEAYAMRELYKQTRVGVRMEEMQRSRTGVLLVAHFKKMWCEIFFVDSMATISPSFIDRPVVTKMLERSNIVYITEFSIILNPKVTQMVAYYAFSRFKHCLLILHRSHFLVKMKDALYEILGYVDIVFLNPKCAAKLITVFDIPQKYRCFSNCRHAWDIYLWLRSFSKKSTIVIVSDGLHSAYVHTDLNVGMSARYKSQYVAHCKIVDYYGAARSFVGGFMAMMIRGYHIDPCVECGFFCSSIIVEKIGVQLPEDEALINKWYILLDHILAKKNHLQLLNKRESSMPFTMFQTPWKERDVNALFGVSLNKTK